jgi:hypothetical protein
MRQVFPIVPAPGSAMLVGIVALVPVILLLLYLTLCSRFVRFEVSREGLRIRGELYGRNIPASELVLDQARPLDLNTERDHGLSWRTNGVGLPGYKSGWFRLKNGEKSLVFITDKSRVAYIPTTKGYSVLLSVERPQEFLTTLIAVTGGAKRNVSSAQ